MASFPLGFHPVSRHDGVTPTMELCTGQLDQPGTYQIRIGNLTTSDRWPIGLDVEVVEG